MARRFNACLRGAVITALVWAPLGLVAWLILHALADRGSISTADDVRALRLGVAAFVVFVACALGSLVAGRGLVDAYMSRVSTTFLLAALAPLPVCAVVVAVLDATGRGDSQLWTSLGAAALVGGASGGFVAALRERDAQESFHERASRRGADSRGWRSS